MAGAAVNWLRDMGLISKASEIGKFIHFYIASYPHIIDAIVSNISDSAGVVFVPALTGLFAPYWQAEARGTIFGLSQFTQRHHLCRALLEAISFQTREVLYLLFSFIRFQLLF